MKKFFYFIFFWFSWLLDSFNFDSVGCFLCWKEIIIVFTNNESKSHSMCNEYLFYVFEFINMNFRIWFILITKWMTEDQFMYKERRKLLIFRGFSFTIANKLNHRRWHSLLKRQTLLEFQSFVYCVNPNRLEGDKGSKGATL